MKIAIAIAAVGVTALLSPSPAEAARFTPASTRFTASGPVGLANSSGGFSCTANLKGKTGAKGHAKITSVRLTGSDPNCATSQATGLPWKVKATSSMGGVVSHVGFTGAFGVCGPSQVGVMVDGSGTWTFSAVLAPQCIFDGQLQTSPPITIMP